MPLKIDLKPVVAIVQARMSSTRLPKKVMMEICGKPILWHVVNRLKQARNIDRIVVATTRDKSDDLIIKWCIENSVDFSRGSLEDVLARYHRAAVEADATTIVRITADCPLIDPEIVDRAIQGFSEGEYDHYVTDGAFPDGLDTEVFQFSALDKAFREAALSSEREHVTPYLWKNPSMFRLGKLKNTEDLSSMRWTVDDAKDFELIKAIIEGLKDRPVFHMKDILEFLTSNPGLLDINSDNMRNEGYAKSIKEDRVVA